MKKTKKQNSLDSIYKLSISSFIADSRLPSTSEYVYGYFSSLEEAEKAMKERIAKGRLEDVRSFSIVTIPLGDLDFSIYPELAERTYTIDGNLWNLEYGMLEYTISRSDSPNGKATIMVYPDCSSNKRTYFIKKYFQGEENGRMKSKSEDKTYSELLHKLRSAQRKLNLKIRPKIYEYGFLK